MVRPSFVLRKLSASCIVLCINLWNLSVGSLLNMLKLFAVRSKCTFSEYLFEFIITIVSHFDESLYHSLS